MAKQFTEDSSYNKEMSLITLPFKEAEPEERSKRVRDDLTSSDEPCAKHSLYDSSDGLKQQNQLADITPSSRV